MQAGGGSAEHPSMSDEMARAVARAIRAERSRVGISQDELAARLGVARSVVTAMEQGRRRVAIDEMPELCEALGVGLNVLLWGAPAEDLRKLGL